VLKAALERIYGREFNPMTDIEKNLFDGFWDKLNETVDKGFGNVKPIDPDFDFIEQLKYSNGVFSAFKTHRMQNDIARKLLDEDGNLKPFKEWLNEVRPIANHQVYDWFKTEYDTAVTRAHLAADWQQFERESDVLPNLEWVRSTSLHPGADHQIFWGVIRPIDDPRWGEHRPGDRWNCKCSLRATDKEVTPVGALPHPTHSDKPADGLDNNPGVDGNLFSNSHPYIRNAFGNREEIHLEAEKLMSKKSREDVRGFFQRKIAEEGQPTYPIADGAIKAITVAYQDIKNVTGKPHKYNYMKNVACYRLEQIFQEMKYLGWSDDIKDASVPGHFNAEKWHYYRFTLKGENSYLVVKETTTKNFRLHMIQDADKFKADKIKYPSGNT
jgi:hypothetical protein